MFISQNGHFCHLLSADGPHEMYAHILTQLVPLFQNS